MIYTPYPFQAAGLDWIINRNACALFWGMGTGKTVTTLTAIDRILYDRLEAGPVLIIAPLRVANVTWATEAAKWDHLKHLRVSKIIGSRQAREKALKAAADLYVINRENVEWLVNHLGRDWPFRIVVIDELSSFKSPQARRFKALRKVRGLIHRVIGLTGTPRPNGVEDLWAQMYLLDQGERLGKTITGFRQEYLYPYRMNGHVVYEYRARPGAEDFIYDKLSDICMSISKDDVLTLPGQIYETVEAELPPAVLKQYKTFERDQYMQALDGDGQIVATTAATLTNKLLQFSNGAIYDDQHTVQVLHSAKLDVLDELLESVGGEPVLVFYAYQHDRDRIRERVPSCRILATEQDISDWNHGRIPVAIAHPTSVGHGLNLQDGGHLIIWFGLTWSLELYQQANERLNRPGQKNVCRIYHIIAKGTHDARVLEALTRKERGQDYAIQKLKLEMEGRHE